MSAVRHLSEEDGSDGRKPMNPKHLRRTLYWLALDWIHLRDAMPSPMRGTDSGRRSNSRVYGHPAEWASDKAAEITDLLSSWHDLMAEHRNEKPPPRGGEERRLVAAWQYLEPRCEQLVEIVDAEDLKELPDLHYRIRRTLGATVPKYTLPIPCPNEECELRTLVRVQGVGQDFISCDSCGYTIKEVHYPLLIRMTLDAFINGAAAA
ncbi:hypothetical protein NIIDNTM18_42400 [Mycolicibacterium litorale]|uniref:Uncharacterized protein n=1 Tax=Mycolicibacterium litorale TaxID=758802 RepID=A0A6S6PA17_9MYCO|nr:hypothetical protein [Mycolicibacterium litorale]BCI54962.1 hypothetical protein NIIDNTM18_42400 [Mycolicibacterium litorale]